MPKRLIKRVKKLFKKRKEKPLRDEKLLRQVRETALNPFTPKPIVEKIIEEIMKKKLFLREEFLTQMYAIKNTHSNPKVREFLTSQIRKALKEMQDFY
jgi:translation elongation factor EF-Ts